MTDRRQDPKDFAAIGPLRVQRFTREALTRRVLASLRPGGEPIAVAFCNAHTAEIALRDHAFREALDRFVTVNDGVGLEIAARIIEDRGFPENLNGTDFVPALFGALRRPTRLYLPGAAPSK